MASHSSEKDYYSHVEPFGDGFKITLFSPSLRVSLLTKGATLSSVQYRLPNISGEAAGVADSDGWVDLALGYDTPEEFEKETAYMGRTVGRYAGRIANGEIELEGKGYKLLQNDGSHTLHGGPDGFSMRPWKYLLIEGEEEIGISFHLISPHLDQGFPGEVFVSVSYAILKSHPAALKWNFRAVLADESPVNSTMVNLCNHAYWNLNGVPRRDGIRSLPDPISNHHLKLLSEYFAETNKELIPSGTMTAVEGTPHNYKESRALLEGLEATSKEGREPPGYDDPVALDRWDSTLREAAVLYSPKTHITMRMETTSPAVIVYTANHMPVEATGKAGERFQRHSAVCLETQYFPNSPNIPSFPSTELKKGESETADLGTFSGIRYMMDLDNNHIIRTGFCVGVVLVAVTAVMNIVTTYFLVKRIPGSIFIGDTTLKHSAARQEEYLDCIRRNVAHPEVSSLHLLVEGRDAYSHFKENVLDRNDFFDSPEMRRKIVPVLRPGVQPTYADLFGHADQMLRGKLAMVCNADVYVPSIGFSVRHLHKIFDLESEDDSGRIAVALTRHESEDPRDAILIHDYRGSHDAFIVRPPLRAPLIENVCHPQNCYKAENIVLYELQRNGYRTVNPCRSFMLVHRHAADLRQWLPPADEERYARANPCTLSEAIEMLQSDGQSLSFMRGGGV